MTHFRFEEPVSPAQSLFHETTGEQLSVQARLVTLEAALTGSDARTLHEIQGMYEPAREVVRQRIVTSTEKYVADIHERDNNIGQHGLLGFDVERRIDGKVSDIKTAWSVYDAYDFFHDDVYRATSFARSLPVTLKTQTEAKIEKAGNKHAIGLSQEFKDQATAAAADAVQTLEPGHKMTQADQEIVGKIGVEKFDERIGKQLTELEQVIAKAKELKIGSNVLKLATWNGRLDNKMKKDDIKHNLFMIKSIIADATRTDNSYTHNQVSEQVEQYLTGSGVLPLSIAERHNIVQSAINKISRKYNKDTVKQRVEDYLLSTYVPSLKLVTKERPQAKANSATYGRQTGTDGSYRNPTDDLFESILNGSFQDNLFSSIFNGTYGQQQQSRHSADREPARSQSKSHEFSDVDAEISQLRAQGMDDAKIKRTLSKQYHPDVSSDPRAKEKMQHIVDRFR